MLRVGLQKTSFVDFPGRVCATLFLTGCNLRCPFCHNADLARGMTPDGFVPLGEALAVIRRRARLLGGVCITGGEPTLYRDLPDLVAAVHEIGLPVKVDTNGLLPGRVSRCGADYVALDLKTAPARYDLLSPSAAPIDGLSLFAHVRKTAELLRALGVDHEYRTTVVPGLVDEADAEAILSEIQVGEEWYLQPYRPGVVLDAAACGEAPSDPAVLERIRRSAVARGVSCRIRGAPTVRGGSDGRGR